MLQSKYTCFVFSHSAVIERFCEFSGWKQSHCGVDAPVLFALEYSESDLYEQTGQDYLYEVPDDQDMKEYLEDTVTLDYIRANSEPGEAWGKKIINVPVGWIVQLLRNEGELPSDNIILKS